MWDALAYLRDRNPLPCNVNVFGTIFAGVEPFEDPIVGAALIVRLATCTCALCARTPRRHRARRSC